MERYRLLMNPPDSPYPAFLAMEQPMSTFSEIVDATDKLSPDEQATLLEILRRRMAERSRAQLAQDVSAARAEHARGESRPATAAQIMDEACDEP